ncbi:Fur family transcriptional regulator [Burkholderia multivorans]|uniref:Ferric uptake regulation protein n=1 Tax=Burkholderia multivorans TaxID=87883 RepID=A0AB37ASG3_9BURK|nr:transcriptional repressor [Burkholderia multivorans]PRE45457.1 hypothetical protein C6P99_19360 [Burkholderia multivorans]PRE52145.1 hypothetical protein C6P97_07575 [Burkholderia multivorans]
MKEVGDKGCAQPGTGGAIDVDAGLALARSRCMHSGANLTPLRAAVLKILLQQECFFTAYELVERMREASRVTSAMTVYRVLDFLIGEGLVYRLDTVNGYVATRAPDKGRCVVAICTGCSRAVEMESRPFDQLLDAELACAGLVRDTRVLELRVRCDCCRGEVLDELSPT